MRLVKGDNLRDAIKQFHERAEDHAPTSERSMVFRQLLGQFIDVCNTIEYAHSRGIPHRDIKPANVMLGKYGETLVVDWGLAKAIGRSEAHRTQGEETLQPMSGGDSSGTRLGSAVGTPSFMSPEQAAGRLDDLRPTSDVYSLGATLYCILTGKPPLHETDAGTAIRKAQTGDFPCPREIKRDVPAALEAVCLRAMALDPTDRYPSAASVGTDIERWLADEPIDVYRDSFAERAARITRRHRSWVQAAAVATLLIMVCSVAAAVFINTARRRETAAREKAQQLADQNAGLVEAERAKSHQLEEQLTISAVTRLAAQSQAIREELPVTSVLLAIEAVESTRRRDGTILPVAHETLLSTTHNVGGSPLVGHENRLWAVAISSDGRWSVTGSGDGTARRWDLTAEDSIASSFVLRGHNDLVRSVVISPDNRWLVTGSWDNTAQVWDLTADDPSQSPIGLRGHQGTITPVATTPDSRWVVTGSEDKTIRLWDLNAEDPAKSPRVLRGHEDWISSVAISSDGRWLFTGSGDGTTRRWDLASEHAGESPLILRGHEDAIYSVAISSDDKWLVTGSWDHSARLWNLDSENPASALVLHLHTGSIRSLTTTSDGGQLVTESDDGTAGLWTFTTTGHLPVALARNLGASDGAVSSVAVSPNGRWVVSGTRHGTVRIEISLTPMRHLGVIPVTG